jgi:acetyltransferase-like isoleucine patch superfamily enzyme
MIHYLADVKSTNIGDNTNIWQFAVVLKGAVIGSDCNINCHTFIENDVVIEDNVTVKAGVYLWDGITIENNVFIGPNVTFTNDNTPRSKQYPVEFLKIRIKKFASIGANATILGGVTVNEYAMIGAGSLVTKDVPARALVVGTPAKIVGWLNKDGTKMILQDGSYIDKDNKLWIVINNELKLKDENPLS